MAGTIPLAAVIKTLIEQNVIDKKILKRHLETDVKIGELPPVLKAMLEPILAPIIKRCEK